MKCEKAGWSDTLLTAAETAMTTNDVPEENASGTTDDSTANESLVDGDDYLTTVNGRTALLEGTPLEEVIQVFDDHGLGTWFQITEVRDECQSYDTEAVYAVIEFLKKLGVVNEDVDRSVCMEDTYQNRALVTKFGGTEEEQ